MTGKTYNVDKIRRKEYPALNETCYLDYSGTLPYAKSLVDGSAAELNASLYGNPHSNSPSSLRATETVDRVRLRVLQFFRADPAHFDVVFVANATAAIKLVGWCFQDYVPEGFWYGYHSDAHTSLVGLREIAQAGSHCFTSDNEVEKWLDATMAVRSSWSDDKPHSQDIDSLKSIEPEAHEAVQLLAYPAQSNLNGCRHLQPWPLRVRQFARRSGHRAFTLLDAAAFVSSAQLDLSDPEAAPDFTALSFYKIFGMPDLGALIVRKESSYVLTSRRYFGGGTVDMVLAHDTWHAKKSDHVHSGLEDGTVPFHSLVVLDTALTVHARLFGSMDAISKHATRLSVALYASLSQLRHANGRSVCEVYQGTGSTYGDSTTQGPTVAFSIRRANGAVVPIEHVESLANACNIQIRTGGVCNPGGIAGHLQLSPWEMRRSHFEGFRCGQPFKIRGGKPTGVIRASLGAMSNDADIQTFTSFVAKFFVNADDPPISKTLPGLHETWTVEKLQISPIKHGAVWEVPQNQDWEVEATRLAFDHDWCVVEYDSGKVISDAVATRLTVQVSLQTGTLLISRRDTTAIAISLWKFPAGEWALESLEVTSKSTRRIARRYASAEISAFLTLALGRPCTLGRYYEIDGGSPILPGASIEKDNEVLPADGMSLQFGSRDSEMESLRSNIVLSYMGANEQHPESVQDIEIGSQRLVPLQGMSGTGSPVKFRHLPDGAETVASQNTVIRVGDIARVSREPLAISSSELSDFRSYLFCPVSGCSSKRTCFSDLDRHIKTHAKEFIAPRRKPRRQRLFSCFC